MASNQYSYPPPPPPPPPASGGYGAYQQQPYLPSTSPRGGHRGRGSHRGHGARGDYQAAGSSPFNPHGGGYSPNPLPPMSGGYGQQSPAPYIGPQNPASAYMPPQWPHEQQQHPQQMQQPPQSPIQISSQNYHPNYAPQGYGQPSYGQPQPYQNPLAQNTYVQSVSPSQPQPQPQPQDMPPVQQWSGTPNHPQPPYNGGSRGRGRGQSNGRGGFNAPLMGPPIRMGFDSEQSGNQMAQASNSGYPPTYPPQQQGPQTSFSPPPYNQGYPPQEYNQLQHRPYPDRHNSHSHSQGFPARGGPNSRGRRDAGGDRSRQKPNKFNRNDSRHSASEASTDLPQKPGATDGALTGDGKKKKKKKRKTNTLGLTPKTEEYEESDDSDMGDEENKLVLMLGEDAPKLPSDLAAWIAERKRNWPTKARRDAKDAEVAKRRAEITEAQSARDKEKAKKEREELEKKEFKPKSSKELLSEGKLERKQRKAEKLRKQLERAESKLQHAMKAGMKRKRIVNDESDDDEPSTTRKNGNGKNAKQADSSDDSSDSDSSDSSDSDSDAKPDVKTSKNKTAAAAAAAALTAKMAHKPQIQRPCKYYSTGGVCGKKGKCRFVHDPAVRESALREKAENGGRMTLAQRMIQNDKEKDDLTVFKSIMHLRERGLFDEAPKASASDSDGAADEERSSQHRGDTPEWLTSPKLETL